MKKCPFCAEEIQDEAIKCKHCGEFLGKKPQVKWYFQPFWLIVAFLCIGPFALPLLWINPRISPKAKVIISIIVIILSCILGILLIKALKAIREYYKLIFQPF